MAQNLTYPVFSWGSVDNLTTSPWIITAGASLTGSISDPYTGSAAYTVTNNVASASMAVYKYITYVRDGYQEASYFLKAGTAAATDVLMYDDVVGNRSTANYTWTGGTPSASSGATVGGAGVYAPIPVGGGWWFCRQFANTITKANPNRILIYPSSGVAVAGSVSVFIKNTVLSGSPVYQAVADDENSDDTVYAIAPSGVEDSWVVRNDNRLRGKLRWITAKMTDTPAKYSGFYGYAESLGINVGFKAMLNAGRKKTTLRFSPDSSNIANYIDSTLFEPMTDGWELEEDATRALTFGIRNPNGQSYEGF